MDAVVTAPEPVAVPGGPGRRCVCGHPEGMHEHFRHGTDCGECGRYGCPKYVPIYHRDALGLTPGQLRALAAQDAQVWRTVRALEFHGFGGSLTRRIPDQRAPEKKPGKPQQLRVAQLDLRRLSVEQRRNLYQPRRHP